MKRHPRIAVRAIITDGQNRVLILKRANTKYCPGMWNLPGGKVEFNETLEAAVAAEINEETGLTARDITFFTYLDNLPGDQDFPHYVSMFFTCKATGTILLNKESSDYRWIGAGEITAYTIAFRNEEAMGLFFSQNCSHVSHPLPEKRGRSPKPNGH
jgi:mutator protein MutT